MQKYLPLISRILISAIFIFSGSMKILGFTATKGYMAMYGMPHTTIFLTLAIMIELGGGLSILLGLKAKLGSLLVFLFLIPTTLIFHRNIADQSQLIHLLSNLAIMGGLLMLVNTGPGKISFDEGLK